LSDRNSKLNRRDLLNSAVTGISVSMLISSDGVSQEVVEGETRAGGGDKSHDEGRRLKIVDTNVSLFQWPFRRLPLDESDVLVGKLKSLGIMEAWAGSFEAVLHRDLTGVNQRLAEACSRYPELTPIGSVNIELPDWENDLRRCVDEHEMPGIRLHPNYHGYRLEDARFTRLLELATERNCFVQIAAAMEDTRTQHPLAHVPNVDLSVLSDSMSNVPQSRVQILNERLRGPLLDTLAATPGVYFDTSRVDGTDGVAALLRGVPLGRVLFGTHAPFLIPEAALIRMHESDLKRGELLASLWQGAEELRGAVRQ